MILYLRHLRGSKEGKVETYDLERIRIGRLDDNDLRFDPDNDREVSGQHAVIYRDGDTFYIEDLHSTNGTYVNAQRVTTPASLTDGDTIEFSTRGPKVVFSTIPVAPPSGTIVVTDNGLARPGPGSKTIAMMISEALREAKTNSKGRFGGTTVFMRQLLQQASTHSSKRLRFALICLTLIFVQVIIGLVVVNWRRGQELTRVQTTQSRQREQLKTQQTVLAAQSEEQKTLQEKITEQTKLLAQQGAELERIKALIDALKQGGLDAHATTSGGVAVNLPNVLFAFNSAALTSDGAKKVAYIASVVTTNAQGKKLQIAGHASREGGGPEDRNQLLSEERAAAVANALEHAGLMQDRITTQGYGSSRPVAENTTKEGRQKNRRVEVIIAAEDSANPTAEN